MTGCVVYTFLHSRRRTAHAIFFAAAPRKIRPDADYNVENVIQRVLQICPEEIGRGAGQRESADTDEKREDADQQGDAPLANLREKRMRR